MKSEGLQRALRAFILFGGLCKNGFELAHLFLEGRDSGLIQLQKLVVVDDFINAGLVLDLFGTLGKAEG